MAETMKFIRKSFYEKALNAELDDHSGYQKNAAATPAMAMPRRLTKSYLSNK
jgi:hypothetical protein